jgi:hypothetical protein
MSGYLIPWAGKMFLLKRIVRSLHLEGGEYAVLTMLIDDLAKQLGIPVVVTPSPNRPSNEIIHEAGDLRLGAIGRGNEGFTDNGRLLIGSDRLLAIIQALQKARLNIEYVKDFFPCINSNGTHAIASRLFHGNIASSNAMVRSFIAIARDTYPDLPDSAFMIGIIRTQHIHGGIGISFRVEDVSTKVPDGFNTVTNMMIG